ncbi:MAG: hypothetical protein A6F70_01615 [Cycloclasticus sp. symbiont of Bathymodiolus heckerae]|nr:MAG: hypothetical protein A6F70_01615 [Cycloclasticus sp. symbiont of Bathymodiolus heckerae]
MTATDKKITIIYFVLFFISALFFFDVIRIDMEDKTKLYPVFISGEPAEMPAIEERLNEVNAALCSSTKEGQKVVRLAVISILQHKADDAGGNGLVDVMTRYGKHPDLNENCQFGVAVSGVAVRFAD